MSIMIVDSLPAMKEHDNRSVDRRTFIRAGSAVGIASVAGCLGGGGGGGGNGGGGAPSDVEPASSISFISESTPPSVAINEIIGEFTDETGIEVDITLTPFDNYSERLASDINSQSGNIQVFYADPYIVGSRYYPDMQPLDPYIESDDYADIPNGTEDFIESHLNACGYFGDGDSLRGLPYDCPTMLWAYRTDIIENYGDQAESDLGFPFEPGRERTWEEYYQMAEWINENVDEVEYGTGHQAQQHDSLQCDFHNVFWAYGGEDVEGFSGRMGQEWPDDPQPNFSGENGVEAAQFYNQLLDIAHPGSTSWTWDGVGQAFAQSEIAMTPEWHEFNAMFANPDDSQVAENVGWALLPQGSERSVNLYGGAGVAINGHSTPEEKKAAWQFLVWATSPEVQMRALEMAGGTPTRHSVYEREEVQQAAEQPTEESEYPNVVPPVQEAWTEENVGMRPKTPKWIELNEVLYSELSQMIAGGQSAEQAMQAVDEGWSNTL